MRKYFGAPFNEAKKRIDMWFKAATAAVIKEDDRLREGFGAWTMEKQRLANVEADRARKQHEEDARKARKLGQEAPPPPVAVAPVPTAVETSSGATVTVPMIWDYIVENFTVVPDAYKEINATEVRNALRRNEPIAGIRYYQRPQVTSR